VRSGGGPPDFPDSWWAAYAAVVDGFAAVRSSLGYEHEGRPDGTGDAGEELRRDDLIVTGGGR
jgi:hypothetical protein